jgi:hypothetical protein
LFIDDGQLSAEYCKANNLIGYTDAEGKRQGGFFTDSRRVKAQRFRGEKSEAYTASLDSFSFTGYDISKLTVGTQFCELNGIHICNKYFSPATKGLPTQAKEKSSKKINEQLRAMFPEHKDTNQIRFARNEDLIGLVTITAKLHGTSARTGCINYPEELEIKNPLKHLWNVFCDEVLHGPKHIFNFWCNAEKVESLKCKPKVKYDWSTVFGTRRVIKGKVSDTAQDYRSLCAARLAPAIRKGEVWYYEIVGYEDSGAAIMQSVSTKEMPKEFRKRFGDNFVYKYGCLPGTCEIFVYRITVQNVSGDVYEIPWNGVKAKCNSAGIKHVPEISCHLIKGIDPFYTEVEVAKLKSLVEHHTEDIDIAEPLDESHIREGICVRVENMDTGKSTIWKNKTFAFKVLEGIAKNDDSYVDTEEVEGDIDEQQELGSDQI